MRACERLGPLLDAYHDGELWGPRLWQVRRHVVACESCRDLLAGIEPLGRWVRDVAGPVETPDLWADLEPRLPVRSPTAPTPLRRRLRPAFAMPALGAAAAAALVAAITLGGPTDWTGLLGSTSQTVVRSLNTHGRPVMVLNGPDDETIIWLMDDDHGQVPEDSTSVWI